MPATFSAVDGFRANVQMLSTQAQLPLKAGDAATVCAAIGDGYTYLTLRNVYGFEVVKATCSAGVVVIERGSKPIGGDVCVAFEWTKQAMQDFIAQGAGGAGEKLCAIEPASDRLSVTMDGCTAKIDIPACGEVSWRDGNSLLTIGSGGCISSEPVAAGAALRPGTYKNATITVDQNGQIVAIEQGENIVFTGGGCCTCQGGASAP